MLQMSEPSSVVPRLGHAYFRVVSDLMTLDEITERSGEMPTSGWSRGDRLLRGRRGIERVMTFSSWSLDSPLGIESPIYEQVDALYHPVARISNALRGVTEMSSTLQIVQYFSSRQDPGFHFSREWVSLLATMGATVDVDQYE